MKLKPLNRESDVHEIACECDLCLGNYPPEPMVELENVLSAVKWLKKELDKEFPFVRYPVIKDIIDEAFDIEEK